MAKNLPDLEIQLKAQWLGISEHYQGVVVFHSGGVDSTALLWILWQLAQTNKNFALSVFHLNYGVRGAASDGDERYSEACAEKLGLPFSCRRISAAERAARPGRGIQAWARRLRQAESARFAAGGWATALGHHLDDLAETVLLRLARGAGPGRLLGMEEWAPPYWRPLLREKRSALAGYLAAIGVPHRVDETNRTLIYSRNVVRHRVLPELERLFPGVAERLVACAQEARDLAAGAAGVAAAPHAGELRAAARGTARQAVAAMVGRADAAAGVSRPRQLSRRLLDAALAPVARATDLPGGGQLACDRDGRLGVSLARRAPKTVRAQQHLRSLDGMPQTALLEPGSHAIFRRGGGLYAISREFLPDGRLLASIQATVYGLKANPRMHFAGLPQSYRTKRLLQMWAPAGKPAGFCLVLEQDGQPLGIFDGVSVVRPGPDGKKSQCSQSGLNLRYLSDRDSP